MKDFEEFRLENFNNLLPTVKEIVDEYFYVYVLKQRANKYHKKLEELQKEKVALETLSEFTESFSQNTNNEIKNVIEKLKKEINEIKALISESEDEIDDLEILYQQYNNYLIGIGLGFSKNNGKILEKAGDVKVEYLREYFFLMFCLDSNYCYGFSSKYLLSEEATEYICKYLLENEEEDIANKKIAVLRGDETLHKKDFLELFK